jgi:hypothetical protein
VAAAAQVLVKTADQKGAGTNANVWIALRGADGKTKDWFPLTGKDAFQESSRPHEFTVPDRVPMVARTPPLVCPLHALRAARSRAPSPVPSWYVRVGLLRAAAGSPAAPATSS